MTVDGDGEGVGSAGWNCLRQEISRYRPEPVSDGMDEAAWRRAHSLWCWRNGPYDDHNWGERRRLFLSIARYLFLNRPIDGYYFEFGGYRATTMRLAYDSLEYSSALTYVEFDSFAGLPEVTGVDVQGANWSQGILSMSEDEFRRRCVDFGMPPDRLVTVPGFYDHTLTDDLADRLLPTKAAVIYIDCDLYASTVPVLNFLPPFLQVGTVVVFDDWFCFFGDPERGERRAWREFRNRHPALRFEPFVGGHEFQSFLYLGRDGGDDA